MLRWRFEILQDKRKNRPVFFSPRFVVILKSTYPFPSKKKHLNCSINWRTPEEGETALYTGLYTATRIQKAG